jgi:hypothetical protein
MGETRIADRILLRNAEGKRPILTLSRSKEDNTLLNLEGTGLEGLDWFKRFQNKDDFGLL